MLIQHLTVMRIKDMITQGHLDSHGDKIGEFDITGKAVNWVPFSARWTPLTLATRRKRWFRIVRR